MLNAVSRIPPAVERLERSEALLILLILLLLLRLLLPLLILFLSLLLLCCGRVCVLGEPGGGRPWWGGSVHHGSPCLHEEGRCPGCSRAVGAMSRIQTFLLYLLFCSGNSESSFWFSDVGGATAEAPTEALTISASSTPTGPTTASVTATNATKEEEEEENNVSGMGEEILEVASEFRVFVEMWNSSGGASGNPNNTGKASTLQGEGERRLSTPGSGGDSLLMLNSTGVVLGGGGSVNAPQPLCLPLPSDWPICSGQRPQSLTLPNVFNHTSVDQVGAVLKEWAWLVEKGCHPGAEWFLCLLLVPGCPAPGPALLPCRSSCQTLRDSCWAWLDDGRLPVACHHLPEAAPGRGLPTCMSVGTWKGNLTF